MNGVIDVEKTTDTQFYTRFSCSFVQKRLFNYFSEEIFDLLDRLYDPFEDLGTKRGRGQKGDVYDFMRLSARG